jgi:hypothetical protein
VAAGAATELVVLHENPGQLVWLPALLLVGGAAAAAVLALGTSLLKRGRTAALVAALGLLLLAPGSWALQTLGHATNGTFPAGGLATAAAGGGMGGLRGPVGPGGAPGPAGAAAPGGPGQLGLQAAPGGGGAAGGPPIGAGGPFGGDGRSLSQALAYVEAHGGGTLAVSSQSGAAGQLISTGADVAALGGFSGRESQVSVSWLADAVADGRIRWVLADGAGGMPADGRTGSSQVMAAVERACSAVSSSAWGGGSGSGVLYDCAGHADDLRALA